MATLLELTAEIVTAHASSTQMTSDELLQELQKVYSSLQALEAGEEAASTAVEQAKPALTVKQAFRKDEVICMICGKRGMKALTRHLRTAHDMKPGQYRKQFGIKANQSLTARNFSEARRQMAKERGLADVLAKAREVRAAKLKARNEPAKKVAPVKPVKAKTLKAKADSKTRK
jgi:predicted transcriptional regulator